jgi:hypothetical protein
MTYTLQNIVTNFFLLVFSNWNLSTAEESDICYLKIFSLNNSVSAENTFAKIIKKMVCSTSRVENLCKTCGLNIRSEAKL